MRFTVVEVGYDQQQVDACLADLGIRAARLAARLEGLAPGRDWDLVRAEAAGLCELASRLPVADDTGTVRPGVAATEREAAQILARAREELDAARAEARRVRERAYAEAVVVRREAEEVLRACGQHATRLDELLDGLSVPRVPVETPTAAAGRPDVRPAAR